MPSSLKNFGLAAMTAQNPSLLQRFILGCAAAIEPIYASVMRVRNFCYDRGIFKTHDLGRFAISVGNITTGGTGKTPVVIWLAEQLRNRGKHPAILLRGYRASASHGSDEAMLMVQSLNNNAAVKIPVQPDPSRINGAQQVLTKSLEVDVFILDDAFQHRRARRDFNLVLISATSPFGFGHVLPRGLLREPIGGLKRADAFLITRCSGVSAFELSKIESILVQRYPTVPIYHADHLIPRVWMSDSRQAVAIESLGNRRLFPATGIGDPVSFINQIRSVGCDVIGGLFFDDHHEFTEGDVRRIMHDAREKGCDCIVTTEKDWVKIGRVVPTTGEVLPVAVTMLELTFRGDEGAKMMGQIQF